MTPCIDQLTPSQLVAELARAHGAAAEELEGLYEARLAFEAGRYAQLQTAKTDAELSAQEALKRQADMHAAEIAAAAAAAFARLAAETARADAADAARVDADAVWSEALAQTEADLVEQAERDGQRVLQATRVAGEVSDDGRGGLGFGALLFGGSTGTVRAFYLPTSQQPTLLMGESY